MNKKVKWCIITLLALALWVLTGCQSAAKRNAQEREFAERFNTM